MTDINKIFSEWSKANDTVIAINREVSPLSERLMYELGYKVIHEYPPKKVRRLPSNPKEDEYMGGLVNPLERSILYWKDKERLENAIKKNPEGMRLAKRKLVKVVEADIAIHESGEKKRDGSSHRGLTLDEKEALVPFNMIHQHFFISPFVVGFDIMRPRYDDYVLKVLHSLSYWSPFLEAEAMSLQRGFLEDCRISQPDLEKDITKLIKSLEENGGEACKPNTLECEMCHLIGNIAKKQSKHYAEVSDLIKGNAIYTSFHGALTPYEVLMGSVVFDVGEILEFFDVSNLVPRNIFTIDKTLQGIDRNREIEEFIIPLSIGPLKDVLMSTILIRSGESVENGWVLKEKLFARGWWKKEEELVQRIFKIRKSFLKIIGQNTFLGGAMGCKRFYVKSGRCPTLEFLEKKEKDEEDLKECMKRMKRYKVRKMSKMECKRIADLLWEIPRYEETRRLIKDYYKKNKEKLEGIERELRGDIKDGNIIDI